VDLELVRLLLKVCAFCEKEGHVIMDYAFVPFHIIVGITKCGSNIIGSTI
jgi:hypothetical protein